MVKRLPSENIAGMLALNYKPQGIEELLKLIGVDGLANMSATKIGITLDDFVKANKGDLFLAATDVQSDSFGRPNANFVFSVSIGDKKAFDKLVTAGKTLGGQAFGGSDPKYFLIATINILQLATNRILSINILPAKIIASQLY